MKRSYFYAFILVMLFFLTVITFQNCSKIQIAKVPQQSLACVDTFDPKTNSISHYISESFDHFQIVNNSGASTHITATWFVDAVEKGLFETYKTQLTSASNACETRSIKAVYESCGTTHELTKTLTVGPGCEPQEEDPPVVVEPPTVTFPPGQQTSGTVCYNGQGDSNMNYNGGLNPNIPNQNPMPLQQWITNGQVFFPVVNGGRYASFHVRAPNVTSTSILHSFNIYTETGGAGSCGSYGNRFVDISITKTPGDFSSAAYPCRGGAGAGAVIIAITLKDQADPVYARACKLIPNQDYYINIRYPSPADVGCDLQTSSCDYYCRAGEPCSRLLSVRNTCWENKSRGGVIPCPTF